MIIRRIKNRKGFLSIEASFVIPFTLAVIIFMFLLNMWFFKKAGDYENASRRSAPDYVKMHRAVSALFDAGGKIYETFFGN